MYSEGMTYELNIDGLVGPTHNYGGLSNGNIASFRNALSISNPQKAVLQGLSKMRLLSQLGLKQAVFPPHQRPNLALLHQLGFTGSPQQQIEKAYKIAPELLIACYSASSMWAANACTVSSSLDTANRKVHFTAANLIGNLHRHQEANFSNKLLKLLFSNPDYFEHHEILPRSFATSDEGAANHIRLCEAHNSPGINLFVYGKVGIPNQNGVAFSDKNPKNYPARQTLEASQAVARSHLLNPEKVLFVYQNPTAIDEGAFHSDVVAVGNESVLFVHEEAFLDQKTLLRKLKEQTPFQLHCLEIKSKQLSLPEAVNTYLFNSQLITLPDSHNSDSLKKMALIAPGECENNPITQTIIEELIADSSNPIATVHYLDLRQSMRNGGGPACLRLRVPLTKNELENMNSNFLLNDKLFENLEAWAKQYYRTELKLTDLRDSTLLNESLTALDELTQILGIGAIYPFQQ